MMGAVLLAGAAAVSTFACQIERQAVVNRPPGGDWGGSFQQLAEKDRPNFRFILIRTGERDVQIKTDIDVMNIAGKTVALPLAPGQIAFAIPNGRCTFTERLCLAMVQFSEMGDSKASVAVTVAGSAVTPGRDVRDHLQLMFLGSCVAIPGGKPQ